ncbi:major facilitator superfamily domain-containing protein [Thamnidium elegans]|nr:major facilitator superfamily domain-containing protein [Thamnidium elegans]
MTFVLNMDRTNISNAISDNLPGDLGFGITGINTGTLVHAIVFTVVTIVTNPLAKRMSAHLVLPNFDGYIAIRFAVALTEAGFIPASLIYLTSWYKTNELATRLSWFWGIQYFASAFSGLISFGIFRMSGIGGLHGWKWLFIIDGIFTHIVGVVAFFYIPGGPCSTAGFLRGKNGWFTERERNIAVTRIIRDDKTKTEQKKATTWHDVKISVLDTNLWTHLFITFLGIMPLTPIHIYFPTLIKGFGFAVTTSNLLTIPACFIGLFFSILIAKSADRYGNYALHAIIGCVWSMVGFLAIQFIPDDTGRWGFYAVMLFMASTPSWHGMQVAWMSSNLAPVGKRTIALGAVVGAANICSVPGSQIYQENDAPRFHTGNWINFGIITASAIMFIFQRFRYSYTNKYRSQKWNAMSDERKKEYLKSTTDEGSNRLDFRFRL